MMPVKSGTANAAANASPAIKTQRRQLDLFISCQTLGLAAIDPGLANPVTQIPIANIERTSHIGKRATLIQNQRHSVSLELLRKRTPRPITRLLLFHH